jgi:hypothetical protein
LTPTYFFLKELDPKIYSPYTVRAANAAASVKEPEYNTLLFVYNNLNNKCFKKVSK